MVDQSISQPRCHALLPTAGSGLRLGGVLPKQFQELAGKPMLAYAVQSFIDTPEIESIWIGISASFIGNPILKEIGQDQKRIHCVPTGGATRQETVRNTLGAMLESGISENDWVLVHDAARPGILPSHIQGLIRAIQSQGTGGLLAILVADTLKQSEQHSAIAGNPATVEKTISRNHLWQAQTPQMFPLKKLFNAIENGIRLEADITDESSAMELAGAKPILVEGTTRNLKVTNRADWELMESILQSTQFRKSYS